MLEERSGRQNGKYRLPNNALFVRAHECSGRVAMNQYKLLVRLLADGAPSPGRPPGKGSLVGNSD